MARGRLAYVDTSAFVKLVLEEDEATALRVELAAWEGHVASRLLRTEAIRACARYGPSYAELAREASDFVALIPLDAAVLGAAAELQPAELKTLDALHLATAMGTPIVALFGPTVTEFGFGPLRPGDVVLGMDGLLCRPCSPHGPPECPLGHHRCMRDLTAVAVVRAIEDMGALRRRN